MGRWKLGLVVAAATMLLPACQAVSQSAIEAQGEACPSGSDCYDPVRPVGPGGQLKVESFEWGFDLTQGVARDGAVKVVLENIGGTAHNFTIDAAVGETKTVGDVAPGESVSNELLLFGGTSYTYYCSIPGHREQGMEGELRVLLPDEQPTDLGDDTPEQATLEPTPEPAGGAGGAGGGQA